MNSRLGSSLWWRIARNRVSPSMGTSRRKFACALMHSGIFRQHVREADSRD